MRQLRQARLGGSIAKCLMIVDLASSAVRAETSLTILPSPQHGAPILVEKSHILQLPNELLVLIVEFAAINSCSKARDMCGECLKVSIWNRFAEISQPLLFRTIRFEFPIETVPPGRLVRKLHHTLKGNPRFRQHCRSLSIYIPDGSQESPPHKYLVANEFARWLTGIRCLKIHGGFENNSDRTRNTSTWTLIRQFVTHCRDIEHLQISREGWGLYLDPIFKWLDFPKLKTLSVHGISEWKRGRIDLEPRIRRAAPFTSLIISDYEEGLEPMSLLIQWPAVLSHFQFGNLESTHVMDYPIFESWLLIHKDTLKHIDIGYLSMNGSGSSRLFNATLFPNLEFLKLSRWQMHQNYVQFRASDANVLGPKLKIFCWDFSTNMGETWTAFKEADISWIHDLANAAVASKSILEKIEIQFSPSYGNSEEGMAYPWDLMDDLRDHVLRSKGLDLVYNDPPITKENWMEYLQARKKGFTVEDLVYSAKSRESSLLSEEQSTGSSEVGYEGGYQGEDIRKYFISTSSV